MRYSIQSTDAARDGIACARGRHFRRLRLEVHCVAAMSGIHAYATVRSDVLSRGKRIESAGSDSRDRVGFPLAY